MSDFIELDGSAGEGGGQILRSALTLSLLTGQAFHLRNLRANRPKPGLQPQHLMSVRAAQRLGSAHVIGATLHSRDLIFEPGPVCSGQFTFEIGTAGATGLVLHTIYLPLALRGSGPSQVTIRGGTHVRTSPAFPFLNHTWRPLLGQLGLNMSLKLVRPGFYPRGGGSLLATIPVVNSLPGIRWEQRGPLDSVEVVAAVAGLDRGIARRMARRLGNQLGKLDLNVTIRDEQWDNGPGCVVFALLETTPAPVTVVAVGEPGKPAESVADEAFAEILRYVDSGAALDPHSADQVLLPLALATSPSVYRVAEVTRHLTTNAEVVQRFVRSTIRIEGKEGQPGTVTIEPATTA
ncbi:MAG: RNA 3'-terminal phosphate cyclase [Gemmataceae bacterium]